MDAVDEIKSRLSIEDVVAEYVQLKRAGRNFKGLSPFSNEKTPSFVVSPEKQIWHDFSSGRGGDMFTFVQEMEGLDFKGALELLARRAGVDLEQFQGKSRGDGKQKERLYELLEMAARFYQVQFSGSKTTLEYVLKTRNYSKETALAWRLGYSPNTGDAMVKYAQSKGFKEQEIKQAGLTNRFGGDLFRGRLMIPLQDPSGRVIGFTARLLDANPNAPKYINTPQTPLYDKSRHVYGLHLAKAAIRSKKHVVLAEGNLDVIASHQAGVMQCVATAGTALTEHQLKALKRLTGDVRLCFDADRAGIDATERSIPIASKVGVALSVIVIPSGKDPDELIKQDPKLWEQIIAKPQYALDWLIERYQGELDLTKPVDKLRFSDTILTVIKGLNDRVEQEHYVQKVADIIDVSREALLQMKFDKKESSAPVRRQTPKVQTEIDRDTVEALRTENRLLALLLLQPRLRDLLQSLQPVFLHQNQARQILKFLQDNPDFDGNPAQSVQLKNYVQASSSAKPNEASSEDTAQAAEPDQPLRDIGDYVKMLVLQYEELYQELELLELRYEAERLQAHLVEHYVKTQKHEISQKLKSASEEEETKLLTRDKELNELLKKFKRG